ncbi:hypothetical protein [Romboutsia sp.]|uniref:hypothetical protein n=1 Tax=Romboutsia sp. TaxID=1965302 RepID=UPI002D1D8678|nr:hypothetical protein [Romboutsia sp.]HSQ89788.1 hypothetical protein [Romboutsia sp.]
MKLFSIFKKKKVSKEKPEKPEIKTCKQEEILSAVDAYEKANSVKDTERERKLVEYEKYLANKLRHINYEIDQNVSKGHFSVGVRITTMSRDEDKSEEMIHELIEKNLLDLGYSVRLYERSDDYKRELVLSVSWYGEK